MIDIDNNIYVLSDKQDKWMLKFPKYNIETNAYIGKNGVTKDKREGDGKTPLGEFELGFVLSMKPIEKSKEDNRYMKITKNMYWIDDSKSKYYNQLVDISKVKKDWNSAEHLIDYPIQYEYLIEIKTNPNNIPEKGSAIFLHCTNDKQTAGCIAINSNIMKKLIEKIDKETKIKINV